MSAAAADARQLRLAENALRAFAETATGPGNRPHLLSVLLAEYDRRGADLAAAATPAPPVDVAARFRAVSKVVGDRGPTSYALDRLAEWVEQHPDSPSAQAIARALTGETT